MNKLTQIAKELFNSGFSIEGARKELRRYQTTYGDCYTHSAIEEAIGKASKVKYFRKFQLICLKCGSEQIEISKADDVVSLFCNQLWAAKLPGASAEQDPND